MAKNKVTKIIPYKYDGYSISLETEKSREKFIKRVERIVRSSMENRDNIKFLKSLYVPCSNPSFFIKTNISSLHKKISILFLL